MVFRAGRQLYEQVLVKTEVLVDILKKAAELGDFRLNLLFRTQNVRVVLHKAAHAHNAVQGTARLVAHTVPEFGKAHRQILVGTDP